MSNVEVARSYMNNWMKQRRLKRKELGLCMSCGTYPARVGKTKCIKCAETKARSDKLRRKQRATTNQHKGSK